MKQDLTAILYKEKCSTQNISEDLHLGDRIKWSELCDDYPDFADGLMGSSSTRRWKTKKRSPTLGGRLVQSLKRNSFIIFGGNFLGIGMSKFSNISIAAETTSKPCIHFPSVQLFLQNIEDEICWTSDVKQRTRFNWRGFATSRVITFWTWAKPATDNSPSSVIPSSPSLLNYLHQYRGYVSGLWLVLRLVCWNGTSST
jgi:hypothetical protein